MWICNWIKCMIIWWLLEFCVDIVGYLVWNEFLCKNIMYKVYYYIMVVVFVDKFVRILYDIFNVWIKWNK